MGGGGGTWAIAGEEASITDCRKEFIRRAKLRRGDNQTMERQESRTTGKHERQEQNVKPRRQDSKQRKARNNERQKNISGRKVRIESQGGVGGLKQTIDTKAQYDKNERNITSLKLGDHLSQRSFVPLLLQSVFETAVCLTDMVEDEHVSETHLDNNFGKVISEVR